MGQAKIEWCSPEASCAQVSGIIELSNRGPVGFLASCYEFRACTTLDP